MNSIEPIDSVSVHLMESEYSISLRPIEPIMSTDSLDLDYLIESVDSEIETNQQYLYTVYCVNKIGIEILNRAFGNRELIEFYEKRELKKTRELREIEELRNLKSPDRHIFTVYCRDLSGVTLLNKAFKCKEYAYMYAVTKITNLLEIINLEYKDCIMPLRATVIFANYKSKHNDIEKYNYFKDNYKNFFNLVLRDPIMFFVSVLLLI